MQQEDQFLVVLERRQDNHSEKTIDSLKRIAGVIKTTIPRHRIRMRELCATYLYTLTAMDILTVVHLHGGVKALKRDGIDPVILQRVGKTVTAFIEIYAYAYIITTDRDRFILDMHERAQKALSGGIERYVRAKNPHFQYVAQVFGVKNELTTKEFNDLNFSLDVIGDTLMAQG